ncbi:MAG: glycosyl transferase family 4 [archaeon]|nr:glycosyl transferase family 4 [archaeon]
MDAILLFSALISLILTMLILPKWIKKCNQVDLLWEDMNKYGHPKNVASSGGVVVILAFMIGILFYIAIRTFVFREGDNITLSVIAMLCSILILALIGTIDDFLGWKHGGLSVRIRLFLAFAASIPLVVINSGQSVINLPILGNINLGLIYPLVFIPLGIAGASITYNFLAGFNGLEAGQGIIILSFLSFIAYITGSSWLALMGLCMIAGLLVFYYYNKVPAKVFPGNALTWSIGGLIAMIAILGNFEKIAVFIFIPYILETMLKLRGKLKKQSFGIPDANNNLRKPYGGKIYGITHLAIYILGKFKREIKEKDVVYFIFAIQIVICLLALLIFRNTLFI